MDGYMGILMAAAAGAAVGAATGAFFFGLLWLTVRALASTGRPLLLMISSFFGRTAAAAGAFLFLARNAGLTGVIAGIAAFLIVRALLIRKLGPEAMRTGGPEGGRA